MGADPSGVCRRRGRSIVNEPIDQPNRERFVSELDRNFSVVAAAGSGKTRAITDRIVQIAKGDHARDWLPQLVVVAFTNRAADEMQQRARAEVLQARVTVEVLAAFNRAFFGTIHAFCVRLLESYGHYLGLPPTFDVITDDDEVWNEFVQQQTTIGRTLSDDNRRELLRHVQARALMELGRRAELEPGIAPAGKCPDTDLSAIHRDRADLSKYRRIHETLVETGAAEALQFSVTFRLDTTQLDFVNETFREILNDRDQQVAFVELNPRPQVLPGQVVRLNLQPAELRPDPRGKVSDARKAAEEARQLGKWLQETGLAKLRAETWRDVAVLCPRKEWLQTLRRGLRAAGLNVQIQSEKELKGDSPAYAWLTALLIIMAQPRCSYEIAGLLRELFGISDHDLAVFSQGYGDRFQIETLTSGADVVSKKLSLLAQIRLSILPLPLFDAINEIVRQTQLQERLNGLPRADFENLDGELDALLALAGSSEAEGMTLTEFAEHLRMHFADAREIRPSRPDAIQLITSQKAKGSEWQAVIVPFLTRDVRSASPRYPRLVNIRETGETIIDRKSTRLN